MGIPARGGPGRDPTGEEALHPAKRQAPRGDRWRTTAPGLADSVVAVGRELLERVFIDG
jgi:hypothetical protein